MELNEKVAILESAQTRRVDHLPIISAYCEKIELIDTIDQLVPTKMEVSPGVIVQGMVLDTLSGRSPLYRLVDFFQHQDLELLLGQDIKANSFNDTTVGRAMDFLFDAGTMKIFSALALKSSIIFHCEKKYLHFDTTSVSVWGDYNRSNNLDTTKNLNITNGHSKDKRPDLKQFLIKMLCVDKNIPILGGCEDGNASDKTINNKILTSITKIMATHGLAPGAYIYIADSAMVTKENLASMNDNLFISRLPFTYAECNRVVQEAVEKDCWEEVGVIAHTRPTKNRPVASYKVSETTVTLYEKEYRAIVVHSSAHDKRRQKRIDKELKKSKQELEAAIIKESQVKYYCEKDAEEASERLKKVISPYYQVETKIAEKVKYGRGRPSGKKPRKISERRYEIVAEIKEKKEAIEQKRKEAGCFVLLTNVPQEGECAHSGKEILIAYKEQHGVERNFAFLKDPLIVNDLFLEKPGRIEVLGLILLISLLVWNLMERSMRKHIEQTGTTLQGWDRKETVRPTSFMMSTKFFGVMVTKIDNHRMVTNQLTPVQQAYLVALSLTPSIFTSPKQRDRYD
jgi:transposase